MDVFLLLLISLTSHIVLLLCFLFCIVFIQRVYKDNLFSCIVLFITCVLYSILCVILCCS